jgi:superkiller protein 3
LTGKGVCVLLALVFAVNAEDGRAALERAVELLRQEKYQDALTAIESARRALPAQAQVYNLLGITLTKVGRASEAGDAFRKAIELNPKLADAHKNLGFNYWTAGDAARAEQSFQAALKLNPADEFTHYGLGSIYLATGRATDAIVHLEKAKALVDRDATVSLGLARAYLTTRQFAKAVELLESTARKQPADAVAAGLLAAAYEGAGDLPRALENYERAVRLDPENQDRYLDYTRLLLDLDRYDDSAKVVEEGLRKTQDSYALRLRLGATELMKGNPEKAESAFREAIAMHPEIPLGYVALAKAFMKGGRGAEAADVLRDAREKLPPDFVLEHFYGLALETLDRDREAVDAFSRANALNAGLPETHLQLGKLLFKLGQTEKAKVELERAIELNPRNAAAHFQLSRVYARLGDSRRANRFRARAAELRRQAGQSSAPSGSADKN